MGYRPYYEKLAENKRSIHGGTAPGRKKNTSVQIQPQVLSRDQIAAELGLGVRTKRVGPRIS
jgi:hypothetical protein